MKTMDRHSRRVKFLTIVLPLLALGFLGAVFFFDWSRDDEVQSQFRDQDAEFTSDQQASVEAPRINTRTQEGDEISIQAQSVQQATGEDEILASQIDGNLNVGGSDWEIQSDEGSSNNQGRIAEFRGSVMALIDGRYNVTGSQILADVAERSFQSDFPIEVKSEKFDLSADKGTLTGARGERVIDLQGNVKGVIRLGDN